MSLLTTGKGKKGQIEMLLKEGKSDEEIAKIADTSKSYVQKVKSQLKSNAMGKIEVSDIEQEEVVGEKRILETNPEITTLPEHKPSSITDEKKPLTKNERRKIYNLFFKGKTPSKIVAKIGYPYEVVEAEYRNFRRDSEFDMQTFQKAFMSEHGEDIKDLGPEGEAFVKRYKRDGFLLNDDFSGMVQLIRDNDEERAIDEVFNGKISPTEGWTGIPCVVCGKPMHVAVVIEHDEMGKAILQFCKMGKWGHNECIDKDRANESK